MIRVKLFVKIHKKCFSEKNFKIFDFQIKSDFNSFYKFFKEAETENKLEKLLKEKGNESTLKELEELTNVVKEKQVGNVFNWIFE